MKSMRWLSAAMLVIVLAGSLGGSVQAQTGTGNSGTFPKDAFNNLQVTYEVNGAILTEHQDLYDFTTSRSFQGSLTGDELKLSGEVIYYGGGYGLTWTASVQVDDKRVEETGSIDGTDHEIRIKFNPSIKIPKGAKTGSFAITIRGFYSAGSRDLIVDGELTRDWKGYPPPCNEALNLYPESIIEGYYTDHPGLIHDRTWYENQLVDAYDKFVAGGGIITSGAQSGDDRTFPQAFATGAIKTGYEATLKAAAEAAGATQKLTPGDLFFLALKTTNGNVRDALLTCHAILYRDKPQKLNEIFIQNYLIPLRDPTGYSDSKKIPAGLGQSQKMMDVRTAVGDDQQGLWYHIFGMAATAFADKNGSTPFVLIRHGKAAFKDGIWSSEFWRGENFPRSRHGSELSDYVVYVEEMLRRAQTGAAADPDKQCVNYWSADAGFLLAQKVGAYKPPTVAAPPTHNVATHDGSSTSTATPTKTISTHSPVSLDIYGVNGEYFGYDQAQDTFYGTTPNVIVDIIYEDDGTKGLFVTPLYAVDSAVLKAVGDGVAGLAVYDWDSRKEAVYDFPVATGDYVNISIDDEDGSLTVTGSAQGVIEPIQEFSVPSRISSSGGSWLGWLIAMVVVGGLGAGGWMLYRRGVIRREWLQRIPLPRFLRTSAPMAAQAVAYCPQCGNLLAVGARFCGVCGMTITPRQHFCPQCGEPLVEGARFCAKCGKEFIR
jgi:hypothetical protein